MFSLAKSFGGKFVEIVVFIQNENRVVGLRNVFISDSVMNMVKSLVRKTKP